MTVAANEQSIGLAQVDEAVSQRDHSTQQTAAPVEESARGAAVRAGRAADADVGEFKLARPPSADALSA
ncbi:hypothetical protein [Burkholderia sp. IMCC1007]|uniref:hypothetical protein n=1 Tax=Burkholderia sp. IMCC1007 TaxID=3004104 RepID=UPI0022B335CC|nr:hypothetical protein [Burkholderia sp. IMCC1007]